MIGFHGQTVLHRPEKALTVQIGDGALLARETGIALVYDMRANDMAHGGQGAPLVPVYHAALATGLPPDLEPGFGSVAFVNIGGISNVTFVAAGRRADRLRQRAGQCADRPVGGADTPAFPSTTAAASPARVWRTRRWSRAISPRRSSRHSAPKSLDRNDFTLEFVEGMELSDGARRWRP